MRDAFDQRVRILAELRTGLDRGGRHQSRGDKGFDAANFVRFLDRQWEARALYGAQEVQRHGANSSPRVCQTGSPVRMLVYFLSRWCRGSARLAPASPAQWACPWRGAPRCGAGRCGLPANSSTETFSMALGLRPASASSTAFLSLPARTAAVALAMAVKTLPAVLVPRCARRRGLVLQSGPRCASDIRAAEVRWIGIAESMPYLFCTARAGGVDVSQRAAHSEG